MVFKGLHIYGSYIDDYTFPQAIRLLAAGTIDPSGLISHVLPLEEFGTALTLLAERKAVKVLLDPQL